MNFGTKNNLLITNVDKKNVVLKLENQKILIKDKNGNDMEYADTKSAVTKRNSMTISDDVVDYGNLNLNYLNFTKFQTILNLY